MVNEPEILTVPERYLPLPDQTSVYVQNGVEHCIINQNGSYFAVENTCPHQGAPLANGKIEGDEILCPLHQFRFNFKSGACSVERFRAKVFSIDHEVIITRTANESSNHLIT